MIETRFLWDPDKGQPRVAAAYSFRYDAHLVPAMEQNIAPAVHVFLSCDDRGSDGVLTSEPARRVALLQAAQKAGADWILIADPDERYEDRLAREMARLTKTPVIWTFRNREMYSPTSYRIDGLWGAKARASLFPVLPGIRVDEQPLHGRWFSYVDDVALHDSGLNFYHLRMITPERRRARRQLYAAADPARQSQRIGYDYLDDERHLRTERIKVSARYSPLHVEDGGLWGPDPATLGPVGPDPLPAHLWRMARLRGPALREHAADAAADAAACAPDDPFWRVLSADRADDAGRAGAVADLVAATTQMGRAGPLLQRHLVPQHDSGPAADSAGWARWVTGPATCHDGTRRVTDAPMAVVVIAFQAQATVRDAVASVLSQEPGAEVVVVNTGGGPIRDILGDMTDHVRLIDVTAPYRVGAARNIGIDATTAPLVAFLAADCTARLGWVAGRLARHAAGADMVGNPVIPHDTRSLSSRVASAWMHWRRWPDAPEHIDCLFGLSYRRADILRFGYFPAHLRGSEDDVVKYRVVAERQSILAPEVLTTHRYPTNPFAFVADCVRRGRLRARVVLAPLSLGRKEAFLALRKSLANRLRDTMPRFQSLPGLSRFDRFAGRVLLHIWAQAHLLGLMIEQNRRTAAAKHVMEAEAGKDIVLNLEKARKLQPEDHHILLRLAQTRVAGHPATLALLHEVIGIEPGGRATVVVVRKLCPDPVLRRSLLDAMHRQIPRDVTVTMALADTCRETENPVEDLFWTLVALTIAPTESALHRRAAGLHAVLGEDEQAARRRQTATAIDVMAGISPD